ncbi:translation initiation factor IF-3 [Coleofasciculus chthonoplastes]|uniref:translation initiation factor IF-3 n=1 Tax=Coleofasciculus chthonoplastes TaxID=64178 RepID=UPI000A00A03B|nr:translation initiation factor IF-3 [Coleofasciculus chthonoplastes]
MIANKDKQRINRQIKSPQVLLIDHENNNRGLTDTREALQLAKDVGLDLVVVSERKDAPVAKILDYGKHQYQQKKRQRQSSKPTLKEVKLRPNVGESDYSLRINRAVEWLSKGDSVKFQVRLRGREHQHRDRATELLERVVSDLGEVGKVQSFDRRALVVQIVPS